MVADHVDALGRSLGRGLVEDGEGVLRQPLLMLARSGTIKEVVSRMPVSSGIVARYVPGESTKDAVDATAALVASE